MIVKIGFVLILHSITISKANSDPETHMNAIEMILYWGYPAESHDVVTEDGFILSLFRIPHGRFSEKNSSCNRAIVLMSHGLTGGGAQFVLNPPESSPAFILADAGFDVFLLNHRGTTYSRRHKTLRIWDNEFWQFTLDEFAQYDAPASFDKALQLSGQSSLYWVGHSQGTVVGFMTIADHPEYNGRVKALFQLAPADTSGYGRGLTRWAFLAYKLINNLLKPVVDFYRNYLGSHEISFGLPYVFSPLISLCTAIPIVGPEVCLDFIQLMFGPPSKSLNISRAPVYLAHIPAGTSTWNFLHWAQMASRLKVEHMDHNPAENLRRYGQERPPAYNYSQIDVPVYLFWSRNDWLASTGDIEHVILNLLRKNVLKGGREVPDYNHLDFVVATDLADKVINPIVEIVRSQESNMCAN